MYKFKGKDEIGKYLNELILSKYPSKRQFGKAYLEELGLDTSQDDIRKMSNKITQITKGRKGIPSEDLPVFSKLLNISCEQILSCGTDIVPLNSRMTNYAIAYSNDRDLWENYLLNTENPFLNYDEYGYSVLDYALEAKNINLINYLLEKEFIKFEGADKYATSFKIGDRFSRRDWNDLDSFHYDAGNNNYLRNSIIELAMENNADITALEEMHAREIPMFTLFSPKVAHDPRYSDGCSEKLNSQVAHSGKDILDYFSNEFTITCYDHEQSMIFPFLGDVIDIMLKEKRSEVALVIDNAIKHNKKVVELCKQQFREAARYDFNRYRYKDDYAKENALLTARRGLEFAENDALFTFGYTFRSTEVSNLIISKFRGTTKYRDKLHELNSYAEDIKNYEKWEVEFDE